MSEKTETYTYSVNAKEQASASSGISGEENQRTGGSSSTKGPHRTGFSHSYDQPQVPLGLPADLADHDGVDGGYGGRGVVSALIGV